MTSHTRPTAEKWQARKSALTRDRIVIATLECIVQHGYEATTMAKIAAAAKLSQGSMQYHFGSKIEAIKAAINYLHEKRLADHQRVLEEVADQANPMSVVIDFYWRQLNEDHFIAYQELVIAARTHPDLASVLRPAYQRFIKIWRRDATSTVSQWSDAKRFEMAADVGQYLMEGIAYGRLNGQISDARTRELLAFTKELLEQMTRAD